MPSLAARPPSLHPSEIELDAIACKDAAGRLYWVRIFSSSIIRRTLHGRLEGSAGCRLETSDGWPVHVVGVGLYLVFSDQSLEWIEIVAVESSQD